MNRLSMRQAARFLRRMCTDAQSKRALPDLVSAVSILPTRLQRDAIHLRDAISEASSATNTASDYNSDTMDREEARALARKVIILYSKLAKRADSLNETIDNHDHDGVVNAIDNVHINTQSLLPAVASASTETTHQPQDEETQTSSSLPQEPSKNIQPGRYNVPTAEDAFDPHLQNSANPVVRTFAPHVADLKYRLYAAHHQRVWIGWANWF